jgi:Protein of unknown function (DUF3293)
VAERHIHARHVRFNLTTPQLHDVALLRNVIRAMSSAQTPRRDAGLLLPEHDLWSGYVRLAVEIRRTPHDIVVVQAARRGKTGQLWPWPDTEPVHVMTAWDPGNERPGIVTNRRRQAALDEELRVLAASAPISTWPASGRDPDDGYHDEGVAVLGLEEAAARALAARYGQEAIFSWSPGEWAIVACTGGRRVSFDWTLKSLDATERC